MCLTVLVASTAPLPKIPHNPDAPSFEAFELYSGAEAVRKVFTLPYIVEVAYGGCGCGLNCDEDGVDIQAPYVLSAETHQRYETEHRTFGQLRDYLHAATLNGPVEIFSCWNGDWEAVPDSVEAVTLAHFDTPKYAFYEKEMLTLPAST